MPMFTSIAAKKERSTIAIRPIRSLQTRFKIRFEGFPVVDENGETRPVPSETWKNIEDYRTKGGN